MKLLLSPTQTDWILFGIIFVALSLFIGVAELFRHHFQGSPEITRKLVHILTGVLIFFAPQLFTSGIPALLLAVSFIAINYSAIRFGLLKGMHGTNRVSYGTVYYPISFLILVVVFWDVAPVILSTSILILAFGDAFAALVGENLKNSHTYFLTSDRKSIEGSTVMFVTSFLCVIGSLIYFNVSYLSANVFVVATATALFVTAWEAISSKGFDNLTVPLGAAFMLHFFLAGLPYQYPERMTAGLLLGLLIGIISFYSKFLSRSGSVATFLLASLIYGIGGWLWTLPIFTFFMVSSLLSKFGKNRKKQFETVFAKTDKRDEGQVAANGGLAGALILLWYVMPFHVEFYLLYLASISAVTADTWATEIGTLSKHKPRSIISLRTVEPGTSGGISAVGFLGGMIGSSIIVFSSWLMKPEIFTIAIYLKIVVAGLMGSVMDSFLGATLQAQYRSDEGLITEKLLHSGKPTRLIRGIRFVDNDVVNWFCSITGVVSMYLML